MNEKLSVDLLQATDASYLTLQAAQKILEYENPNDGDLLEEFLKAEDALKDLINKITRRVPGLEKISARY